MASLFTSLRDVAEHTAAIEPREADAAAAPSAEDGAAPAEKAGADHDEGDNDVAAPQLSMATGDVMALKSLCVSCEDEGTTNLLLTRIPFFRDVILMAFECEHCGYRSSELQSAEIQEKGCRFEVQVATIEDMNRQLVKSDRATVTVPELALEIPPNTQKGVFTTVEGLLDRALENLEASNVVRRPIDAAGAAAVDEFIVRLRATREGRAFPFTVVLDDPSGNSFLENPNAPRHDPRLRVRYYVRSEEQNHALGCYAESAGAGVSDAVGATVGLPPDAAAAATAAAAAAATSVPVDDDSNCDLAGSTARTGEDAAAQQPARPPASIFPPRGARDASGNEPSRFVKGGALITADTARGALTQRNRRAGAVRGADGALAALIFDSSTTDAAKEVMRFPVTCFNCSTGGDCRMCVTDVPHFKEVIIMAFTCEGCGWRNVEVKGGGAVPTLGTVTELRYDPAALDADRDMTRDVIKSDTAGVEVPELELALEPGTLGGMYTTVEGLLAAARDKLVESDPFASGGDSGDEARAAVFADFVARFDAVISGAVPFTLRLSDPMANTWVYSPTAPKPDPRLSHTTYARSAEEDLQLGLLDMRTEGYGEEAEAEEVVAAGEEGAAAAQ